MPSHFTDEESTWCKARPEALTEEERLLIRTGKLGYCEEHRLLYKRWALGSCWIRPTFPDTKICNEWSSHGLFPRLVWGGAIRGGKPMSEMSEEEKPNYDGWRWMGTRHLWQDEKLYCHFCNGVITHSSDYQVKSGMAHMLMDEEEFDFYSACEECSKKVIGDLYPDQAKLEAAAKEDGIRPASAGRS